METSCSSSKIPGSQPHRRSLSGRTTPGLAHGTPIGLAQYFLQLLLVERGSPFWREIPLRRIRHSRAIAVVRAPSRNPFGMASFAALLVPIKKKRVPRQSKKRDVFLTFRSQLAPASTGRLSAGHVDRQWDVFQSEATNVRCTALSARPVQLLDFRCLGHLSVFSAAARSVKQNTCDL
jgi:hypothetical protein